jgi:Domain of unknown function (DUF4145)
VTKEMVVLSERSDLSQVGSYQEEIVTQRIAQIDLCSGCGKPSLSTYTWVDGYMEPDDVVPEELYPERRNLEDLPERIRDRYLQMLEIQHAPDAFALRSGKPLETVCGDQGIAETKKLFNLARRLDALVRQLGVPWPLIDQAHLVRDYRNIGSHDAGLEVRAADVPPIRGFVESLLDFLYWGPANLDRVTAELKRRKEDAKDPADANATEQDGYDGEVEHDGPSPS